MHEVALPALDQHVAARHVTSDIFRQAIHESPGADIVPPCIERYQRRLVGLLHHRVVDALVAAGLEALGLQAQKVEIGLGLIHRLSNERDHRRLEALELGEHDVGTEQEEPAVPVVAALGEIGLCTLARGLLDEGCHG